MRLPLATKSGNGYLERIMNEKIESLLDHLRRFDSLNTDERIAFADETNWIAQASSSDVAVLVESLVDDPPTSDDAIVSIFTPLFRNRGVQPEALFPRLLDGLSHPQLAAPILDLANYFSRENLINEHPASSIADRLASLLGEVSQRLCQLEESKILSESPERISEKVSEGVTLAVSLCDALALIGDDSVVGKLYQALEPSHRRLRTEAAAALARLGESVGEEELVKMAAEPVARLRSLAYAEELDLLDKIPDEHKSAVARAEAELALHLSQHTQLGFPPTRCELVDQCEQFWPGYEDPIECFLLRFDYELGPGHYSNVGIVGPLTHAMTADLANLPTGDIYAIFAGWQAEHEDIREMDVERLSDAQRVDVSRLERRARDAGYTNISPVTLGFFFGDRVLVASARHEGNEGMITVDAEDVVWHSSTTSVRPLGAHELWCWYKGKKLLSTFNPS